MFGYARRKINHTLLYLACEEIALEQDNSKERIGLDNPRKNGAQG
jgi:hypothetical protein